MIYYFENYKSDSFYFKSKLIIYLIYKNMRHFIFTLLVIILPLICCNGQDIKKNDSKKSYKKNNALIGQVWEMKEFQKLELFKDIYSSHLFNPFDSLGKQYEIDYFGLKQGGYLIVFCKVIIENNSQHSILVLDTLSIPRLSSDGMIGVYRCRINKIYDKCIIGIVNGVKNNFGVIGEEKIFNNNVTETWRTDLIKEKIIKIRNSNIDYYTEP
jgi:hypothetical protein